MRSKAILTALAVAVTLTACGNAAENLAEKAIESQSGGDVAVDDGTIVIQSDDGDAVIQTQDNGDGITVSGTDASGEGVTLQMGGSEIPDDFPMPLFDPSEVTNVSSVDAASGSSTSVTLQIDPGDTGAVLDFYRGWLDGQGMDVTSSDTMLIGESDTAISFVQVADYGSYSEVVLTWTPSA